MIPPLMVTTEVWDVSPNTTAVGSLHAAGNDTWVNGKVVHTGGVEWTIKDGVPFHGPTLLKEVKDIVTKARAQKPAGGGAF